MEFVLRAAASAAVAALLVACGASERDSPSGTGPATGSGGTFTGQGGQGGQGGGGAAAPAPTCNDDDVLCDSRLFFAECTPDKQPMWLFLSYETIIATDGRMLFHVRVADAEDELPGASFKLAGEAVQGDEVVYPSNPVRLGDVLGPAEKVMPHLEMRTMAVDSSEGATPTLESFDLQFSCEDY